jgi:hypothetical protein
LDLDALYAEDPDHTSNRAGPEDLTSRMVSIANKQELYTYFTNDFANLFFTPGEHVQDQMKIVGPIRMRTQHTVPIECIFPSPLKLCYDKEMTDLSLYKEDIEGSKYNTCE